MPSTAPAWAIHTVRRWRLPRNPELRSPELVQEVHYPFGEKSVLVLAGGVRKPVERLEVTLAVEEMFELWIDVGGQPRNK